jgi:radical SAM protein with 4Fe4S-binding SPASM domain
MLELVHKTGRYYAKLGRMARRSGRTRLANGLDRMAVTLDPGLVRVRREIDKRAKGKPGDIRFLREIIVGTTGQCNASCIHCPTNKVATAHVPRTPMAMPLFESIVQGVVDMKLAITGQIAFGLYGDALLDPFVVERAKLVKAKLPDVLVAINTNAAAFNKARHGELLPYVDSITIHCESLTAETYDELMAPLRFKNVYPKYAQMIAAFPGKIRVSVPVSRKNIGELHAIKAGWLAMGASDVIFDPLASRCIDEHGVYDELSLSPSLIACKSELLDYLVIDSDGMVMACCQDFERIEPIGDIARDGFRAALESIERRQFAQLLDEDRHAERKTCSRCYGDIRTANFPFDHPIAKVKDAPPRPADHAMASTL